MTEIRMSCHPMEGGVRLRVEGELDLYSSQALAQELTRLVQAATPIIEVDLSQVRYLDSSGVAILVKAWTSQRRESRDLRVIGAPAPLRAIFQALALGRLLEETPPKSPPL